GPPPPPAPSAPAASKARGVGAAELSRSEGQAKIRLRTDGIYASEPACDPHGAWSRRFLRFFPNGTVRQLDGNETPKQAFRTSDDGSPGVIPTGTYKSVGRRVSAVINGNPQVVPPDPPWNLDGIVEEDGIEAMSAALKTPATPAHFSFVPIKTPP